MELGNGTIQRYQKQNRADAAGHFANKGDIIV